MRMAHNPSNQAVLTAATTSSSTITSNTVTPPTPTTQSASSSIVNTDARWIFPPEKIESSPSRLDGIAKDEELAERQQAALFISDLGGRLKV